MAEKVILDPYGRKRDLIFWPEDLARLRAMADIVWDRDDPMPDAEIAACREDVAAVICGYWHHGDATGFPKLRAILEVSGGFPSPQSLDYPACFARGIRVLSCAPAFAPAVAEMALGLAIASARQIVETDAAFRADSANWSHEQVGDAFQLYGKQVGFIGFGSLARQLQRLLAPFGCPIQVYDPWLTETYLRSQGVAPVELDTVLSTSRYTFVLAVPSASNRALLDREKLERIPPDAIFLLMSRAHLVDFDALTELVLAGRFRAAIDVFPEEPLPADHPLRNARRAILSSHRAGAQFEALRNIGRLVVDDLEAILRGLAPHFMQAAQPEFIRLRG